MTFNETPAARVLLLPLVDLNRERHEERQGILRRSRRHAAVILVAIALAATVPLPLTLQALALRRECQESERQAAGVRQRLQSVTTTGGEMDAKISRWTRLLHSQQARHAWEVTLPAFADCLPDDVSLQEVQIFDKSGSVQIQLQGSAETVADLHIFTAALARSSVFARLHLDETTVGTGGITFRMTGPLDGALAGATKPSAA